MSEAGAGGRVSVVDALLERLEAVHVDEARRDGDDGGEGSRDEGPAGRDPELKQNPPLLILRIWVTRSHLAYEDDVPVPLA